MNTNVLIGILIVVVVLIGGYFIVTSTPSTTVTPTSNTENPEAGVPTVTTDASATVSNSTAVVSGKVVPNGAQTSYWYEYGLTMALGTRTSPQSVGSGFISIPTPAYITGLSPSTPYYYRLSAQNAYGTVTGATYNFTTNTSPATQGSAPTTRTDSATTITRTTANLNGIVNPNGTDSWYWFEWGTSGDLGNASALQTAGDSSASMQVSLSVSGLQPFTQYYFRLDAQNRYGTVTGSILTFTTPGPAAPGVPTVSTNAATDVATSSATLNGHVNPNGVSTTFWFEYSEDSLLGSLIGSGTPKQAVGSGTASLAESADLSGLARATKYYYRAVARNSYGTVRGDIQSFKTRP